MRVSTLSNILFLTDEADKKFRRISKLVRELATGKRTDLYSTEPAKVVELVSAKWDIDKVEQYADNIRFARGLVLTADDALGKTYDLLVAVKEKLVQAANSQGDYETIKEELKELKNRLLHYANLKVGDFYLFAGNNYTQQPFDTTTYTYNGGSAFSIKVGDNDSAPVFFDGSVAFGSGSNSVFAVIDNVVNNITDHDTVEQAIGEIENYLKQVDYLRTEVGLSSQKMEGYSLTYDELLADLKKRKSDIEDIQFDEAISQYKLADTTYKAVLSLLAQENQKSSYLLKYF